MESEIFYWDSNYNGVLLLNLAVVIGLFTTLRLFSGAIAHIDASKELLRKDNPAFGISLAGVTFAITILLLGTLYGNPDDNLMAAAGYTAAFGLIGIILMAIARFIFDKVALPDVHLRNEIVKGNVAVAIVDAGNVLASAIIIRELMMWVTDNSTEGMIALLAAYFISQFILTAATFLRCKIFHLFHKDHSIQDELKNGNIALALSFSGRKIGTAFAIAIAANHVVYEVYDIKAMLLPWLLASIAAIVILKIITFVAMRVILFRVNIFDEIINQRNIAVGTLQGIVYLSIAMLLSQL
jgi:uncharacterized membrane protein YjfL (UPF0719 family)